MYGGMRFGGVLSVLCLIGFGLGGGAAWAMQDRAPALNPKTYVAPGGKFELKVDPSNRDGRGEGSYVLSQEGKEKWAAKLPFKMWEAGVTDEGVVCGYAYTEGIDGGAKPGEFLIVILDADGKVKLQQSQKRAKSRIVHGPTDPVANGLLVDGANDRMIVRVADPDINQGWESWLVYGISSARAQVIFKPTRMMKDYEKARFILDAELAPGTPLVLLHWWLYDDKSKDVGARYTLVDKQGKPVWTLDLPKDYLAGGKKEAQDKLRALVRKRGGILASDKPGEFEIFVAEKSERVRFALEKDGDKWMVKEVSRSAFVFEEPEEAKPAGASGGKGG
jgi:hypothetical protein